MKKVVGLTLLLVLSLAACSKPGMSTTPQASQPPGPGTEATPAPDGSLWTRTYGDEGENESVVSLLSVSGGGFLLAGTQGHYSQSDQRDVYRPYLLRTDRNGNQLWKKTIDDYRTGTQVSAVFETAGGKLVVFASRMVLPRQNNADRYQVAVTGTDTEGNQLWSKTVELQVAPSEIVMNSSGAGFTVTGLIYSPQEIEVTQIDMAGEVTSRKTVPLSAKGSDYQYYVAHAAASGDFLVAAKKITGQRQSDIFLGKIDDEGRQLWTATYKSPGFQLSPSDVLETSDGGITLVGLGEPTAEYMRPFGVLYLAHLDSQGKELWNMTWGDTTHRQAASVTLETADGGYLMVGTKSPLMPKTGVAYLLRTDDRGQVLWSRIFGDPTGDWWSVANAVLPISSGYVVAGEFGNIGPVQPAHDGFLMRAGPDGDFDLAPLLVSTPVSLPPDPQRTVLRTIPVNRTVTANGIDLTLGQVVLTGLGFRFDLLYTPPGYDGKAGVLPIIPGPQVAFRIDGGPATDIVPPFSLTDKGMEYGCLSDVPIPPEAKELTVTVSRVGQHVGPWEFRISLRTP